MANEPNFEFPALRDALAKLDAARARTKKIFDEAGPEMDMAKVTVVSGSSADKVKAIRDEMKEMEDLKSKVDELKDLAKAKAAVGAFEAAAEGGDGARQTKGQVKSFGEQIEGLLPKLRDVKHKSHHIDVEVKTLFQRTAGWDPEDVRSGRVELTPQRPARHITDYIPVGSIGQSDYKYMEETTFASVDSSSVATSDALAGFVAEGAQFYEGQLALTERSRPVEKVTIWLPVTDEQLEDEPSARSYLDNRLRYMIEAKIDSQSMVGSGASNQLLGTENVAGIQSQAKGSDTVIDAAYKLFTLIRSDGFAEPSVAFIRPTKWQDVVLQKTADGLYVWGHPSVGGPTTVWGVPVVETVVPTATKLVAGDYSTYSMLFMRRGLDVQVTNAHSDFFIKGKQAIRMDARMVLVHFRPKAFGVVTGL